jgi:hypothetical protein
VEYLRLELDDLRDTLVTCAAGDFPKVQGRAKAIRDILVDITNTKVDG